MLLGYFPQVVTYDIRANLVTLCDSRALQHNKSPDKDVKDLSETNWILDWIR